MSDKRQYGRIDFRKAVQYQLNDGRLGSGSVGIDLSEGGVRLRVQDFVPQSAALILEVKIAPEKNVRLEGKVIWSQKIPFGESYQMGCCFSDSLENVHSRGLIRDFIESLG